MKIPNPILKMFPKAKFVEAEHGDIEDDSIELNEEYSIQVGDGYACLTQWNEKEQSMTYGGYKKLAGVFMDVLKLKI